MDTWKAEMGRVREKRSVEERRAKERGSEKRKSQKKGDAGAGKGRKVAKHCVFRMICGSKGSKSRLAKAAGAEPSGQMRDEKLRAVVAQSTFPSHNVQNTTCPEHSWKLRCWKSVRRCGAKHMSKSKCTKHARLGPLLEVQMSCRVAGAWDWGPLSKVSKTWRFCNNSNNSNSNSNNNNNNNNHHHHHHHHYYTTLLSNTLHYNYNYTFTTVHHTTPHYNPLHSTALHYTPLHSTTLNYTTLHCITLHYAPLHSTTFHYTTLNYTTLRYTTLHYTTLHYITLHYTTLHHCTALIALHYTTLHYTTRHHPTLHSSTLHYATLPHIALHYTTLHYTHYTTNATATALHQLHYTTTTIPLHYNYNCSCTTPHYIQQLWVGWPTRWPLQPLQPLQKTQLQPPFGPSVDSLCHPRFTTTNLFYRFPIFETSATALYGTTGKFIHICLGPK